MQRVLAIGMVLAIGALLVFTVSTNLLGFGTFPKRMIEMPENAKIMNILSYENTTKGDLENALNENKVQTFVGNWDEDHFSIFHRENDNVGAGYESLENLVPLDNYFLIEFTVRKGSIGQQILENAPQQTGAANVVTSVVWGYRGYDTLGEATVLFTAVVGVIMVFRALRREE